MNNPFKKGDKVRVLVDIKDGYYEICHKAGIIVEIDHIAHNGESIMFAWNLGCHYENVEGVTNEI